MAVLGQQALAKPGISRGGYEGREGGASTI